MKMIVSTLRRAVRGASFLSALALLAVASLPAGAVEYQFATFAGQPGGLGNVDGTGAAARFRHPTGVAVTTGGTVYVADTNNSTIRQVTAAGVVTTLAGSSLNPGKVDGTGSAARFNAPSGVVVAPSGDLFVADSGNHAIRRVTSAGVVTTFAGTLGVMGSDDGTGTAATFNFPAALTLATDGTLYVADEGSNIIRKITSDGVVTTLAGLANNQGTTNGTGAAARFFAPTGITVDSVNNIVYVADLGNGAIRKITSAGMVTTFAGVAGQRGYSDGLPNNARFFAPAGIVIDSGGNLYVSDTNLRKITPNGLVTTIAGTGGQSSNDGVGDSAGFNSPAGLDVDSNSNVFVADSENNTIRKVTPTGIVTTLAGSASDFGSADGTGRAARFSNPAGVAIDASENVYVSDQANSTIRKITKAGVVTTLAGQVRVQGSNDGPGDTATFAQPYGLSVDALGNLYVADTENNTIRKVSKEGAVTTLAGVPGEPGNTDGPGLEARFSFPVGTAVDPAGNVFVVDLANSNIRRISNGDVSTFAGSTAGAPGSNDGLGTAAQFQTPAGIATDAAGNVYVADEGNATIRKITPFGLVSTLAGLAGQTGNVDGTGSAARFVAPASVAVDASGNVYVSDVGSFTIRMITPGGVVTTIGGMAGETGETDGAGANVRFNNPFGIAANSVGTVYIADTGNNRIVRGFNQVPAAPVYGRSVATYFLGTTIVPNLPTTKGGPADSYSITPELPAGLVFDAATGAITGKPTALSPGFGLGIFRPGGGTAFITVYPFYKVTAQNAYGLSQETIIHIGVVPADTAWEFKNFAGSPSSAGSTDGPRDTALFDTPDGIAVVSGAVSAPKFYVADFATHTIRADLGLVGSGSFATIGGLANNQGSADGPRSSARFRNPNGVVADSAGNVFVADYFNSTIRRISATDLSVTTFAGLAGSVGSADGPGATARFRNPKGLAIDASDNLYVADSFNYTVRKITPAGFVTTIAGTANVSGNADGVGDEARFNYPSGVAVDASGNVYVSEAFNNTIRKIAPDGAVTTVAGMAGRVGSADGFGQGARFNSPLGLAIDATGSVYVADTGNNTIRKVTSTGLVSTLGGTAGSIGSADGIGAAARFNHPFAIAVGGDNQLYIADTGNHRISAGLSIQAPTSLMYANSNLLVYTTQPVNIPGPTAGGTMATRYSVSPALPAGLTLDPLTGAIVGTPTTVMESADFVVMASNAAGSTSTTIHITVLEGGPALAGRYALLLNDTNGGAHAALSLSLTAGQLTTGTLRRENNTKVTVKTAKLSPTHSVTTVLSDKSTLVLTYDGNGRVTATLTTGTLVLTGTGSIAPTAAPAALVGAFTSVLDTGVDGFGYLYVKIAKNGSMVMAGRQPDGSTFLGNQGLLLDRNGFAPLFLIGSPVTHPLLTGTVRFAGAGVPEVHGTVAFTVPGLTKPCDVSGAKYVPARSGLPAGTYPITLGGDGIQITSSVRFDNNNQVFFSSPLTAYSSRGTAGSLTYGTFGFSFRNVVGGQVTGPVFTGNGIYNQKLGKGFGLFVKDGKTGTVVVGPILQ